MECDLWFADTITIADGFGNANTHTNSDANGNTHTHSDANSNGDPDAYSNGDSDAITNADPPTVLRRSSSVRSSRISGHVYVSISDDRSP